MVTLTLLAASAALFGTLATAGPGPAEWASQSIYQVMTDRFARSDSSSDECSDIMKYCGGTWAGLIDNLDYIQGMGFTAIQLSPVVENIKDNTKYGEAYHGYWVDNMYGLNENFGTADDLNRLVEELHNRDMYLMVDVVINNMAQAVDKPMTNDTKLDFSVLKPFDDEKYYHEYCNLTDYSDEKISQNCYLASEAVALPDLDTESQEVSDMINTWIGELVANYSIDGLRIDAAKHVSDDYLQSFAKAADVFTLGEVYTNQTKAVCRYQEDGLIPGLPNFILYEPIIAAFTAGKMKELADKIDEVEKSCTNTSLLGTFAENHDISRFASLVDDMALAKNALAFTILADGIPIVYQGQEQHMAGNFSPYNRSPLWSGSSSGTPYDTEAPLYNLTATLNFLRNHAIKTDSRYVSEHSKQLYVDESTLATRKGPDGVQIVAVFSNQGEKGGDYELSVGPKAFAEGEEVIEVFDCTVSNANEAGNVTAKMEAGLPRAFFPTAQMEGSGLCGYTGEGASGTKGSKSSAGDSKKSDQKDQKDAAFALSAQRSGSLLAVAITLGFWLL